MAQVVLNRIYKQFPLRPRRGDAPSSAVNQGKTGHLDQRARGAAGGTRGGAKSGQSVSVLRDITLTINDGEFMVLVGPSGCGKSTLLRLIAGLEEVTAGTIQVGDRVVNQLPPKQRDIAMVFQNYALYPHMTVYENLAFGLRRINQGVEAPAQGTPATTAPRPGPLAKGMASWSWEPLAVALTRSLPPGLRYESEQERRIRQRVRTVAQMLQIEPLLDRLPRQLSGGQKQRVALGRAMARNPQVFLMDEPLSNLDAKLRLDTRAQIVNLQRQLGITTIYVTHDQTEAMTMGDRIAIMNQGQIQQVATPLELYHHPANRFVAEFIGTLPMNFLTVQVNTPRLITHPAFRLTLPDIWEAQLRDYEGRSLLLGIRPEHLQVSVAAPKNIATVVERLETLGSDTYLTARLTEMDSPQPTLLQARIQPDYPVSLQDPLWLSLMPDKIHLFDPTTERALRPSG